MEEEVKNEDRLNSEEEDFWIRNITGDKKLEDEYLLGDIIGRGASSVVYKCLRKGRTEWACKVLKKKQLNKKWVQSKIPVLLKLNHPNIISLKEVFETKDEIQLILDLAYGGELFEKIVEKGFYSEVDAAQAVRQILNALQHLHENEVIHKDLKPENLLYETEFEDSPLKLADVGINMLLSERQQALNRSIETFGLFAPELLLEEDYDFHLDMWNLGVVTYIMLCGFEPFLDEVSHIPTKKNIIEGNYTFPSPWWDDVSDSAKELITRLLSVDPKSRPTTEEALNHPWILGISAAHLHMNEAIIKLKEFNARRRFRVATKAVLAARRALSFLPNKTKETSNKKVSNSSPDASLDGDTIHIVKSNKEDGSECCVNSPLDDSLEKDKNSICYIGKLTIDGRSVDDENSSKLCTDLTTPYKETYAELR